MAETDPSDDVTALEPTKLPRAEVYTSPVPRGLLRQYQANLESFETAMAPEPALAGLAERLKARLPGT